MDHPILSFLETASICPPYDVLIKFKKDLLSYSNKKFIEEHLKYCGECKKSLKLLDIPVDFKKENLDKINKLLKVNSVEKKLLAKNNNIPIAAGQIWLTTDRIKLVNEEIYVTYYPYYVLVITEPEKYFNDFIIRVQPISTITEFKSSGDIYIDDEKFLGTPFIIETWNEQPMFISELMQYIETLHQDLLIEKLLKEENEEYSIKSISKFRDLEIQNTAYLRNPVLTLISLEEENEKSEEENSEELKYIIKLDNKFLINQFLSKCYDRQPESNIRAIDEYVKHYIDNASTDGYHFLEHTDSMFITLGETIEDDDENKEFEFEAKIVETGEKIIIKTLEEDLPNINCEGIFKAKFYTKKMNLNGKILLIGIKHPETKEILITFKSTFQKRGDDKLEAYFSEGEFNVSCSLYNPYNEEQNKNLIELIIIERIDEAYD